MVIPHEVQHILSRLRAVGFEAWAVGGCVRDRLLGREPNDWDICTSSLPPETKQVFSGFRIIETGLKHGTVTVMIGDEPYEITTFRQDGDYADHRRPEQVRFVRSLREDLARRDFTVNAMAAGPDGQVIDLFGGQEDLKRGIIRAVGDPHRRFEEDALRILRGLRFAARLGFSIHPDTARAMEEQKELLRFVSPERIYKELTGILVGKDAPKILREHGAVLTAVLPEIEPAMGFRQHNPCHHLDVWEHTLLALEHSPQDAMIRWALLLHDLGKPRCFTRGEDGVGHFYGHPQKSEEMAREIFARLKADNHTRDTVCTLVRHHDQDAPASEKTARRWLLKFGRELLPLLMEVKVCDCLAHADTPKTRLRLENTLALKEYVEEALRQELCLSIHDLKIGGKNILDMGIAPGPEVGQLLNALLEDVIEGRCKNEKNGLLARLEIHMRERSSHGC